MTSLGRRRAAVVRAMRAALFAACLLGLAVSVTAADQPTADWKIDDWRWKGELAPSTAVEVVNPWGDVRLRAADAGEMESSAMIQRRTADPARAEVHVERRGSVLRFEVVYPTASKGDLHRVDLALFVPKDAPVTVSTRAGLIQARGLASDLRLRSTSGKVVVSTSGTVDVETDDGDVEVTLAGAAWKSAPRLVSRDGDIALRLDAKSEARVDIKTRGEISMQAPAHLERRRGGAVVTYGEGSKPLSLQTRSGHVTLLSPVS
jgi:hypothetical protein